MTVKTLSKILGVDEKKIIWNGHFFFYEDPQRVVLRIDVGKEHVSFYTNMRVYTPDEQEAAAKKLSGRVKNHAGVKVKDFKNKEDKERIRKCFERMK